MLISYITETIAGQSITTVNYWNFPEFYNSSLFENMYQYYVTSHRFVSLLGRHKGC